MRSFNVALLFFFFLLNSQCLLGQDSPFEFTRIEVKEGQMNVDRHRPPRRFYRLGKVKEDLVNVVPPKAFEIMTKEVTQKEWAEEMKYNPSFFSREGDCDDREQINNVWVCPNHPIEKVSWNDAQAFIASLNSGKTGCNGTPSSASGCYRLPTSVEWEYAARAGAAAATYFFGNGPLNLENYAWHSGNANGRVHPVGTKLPNPWGLYDMYGNVWEWVQNGFTLTGYPDPSDTTVYSSYRFVLGGSWSYLIPFPYYYYTTNVQSSDGGFRLVRNL